MASAIGGTNFQFVVLVGFLRLELRIQIMQLVLAISCHLLIRDIVNNAHQNNGLAEFPFRMYTMFHPTVGTPT